MVLSLAILLVAPFRGTEHAYYADSLRDRHIRLQRYALSSPLLQCCRHNGSHTCLKLTSGLRPGCVCCVVRTNVFERYSHPSDLPSELHRLQRESMFLPRGLSLCQIWWGAILDVVAFKEPFPLMTSDGGLNSCPRHECCMTLPREYDRLLAKRVTHQGHDVSLAHVLRQ